MCVHLSNKEIDQIKSIFNCQATNRTRNKSVKENYIVVVGVAIIVRRCNDIIFTLIPLLIV